MRSPPSVRVAAILVVAFGAPSPLYADGTLQTMATELDRSMKVFADEPTPVYYLSYEITEERSTSVDGSFGSVTGWSEGVRRVLDIDLRVGSYDLDNTHPIRGRGFRSPVNYDQVPLANAAALRSQLWYSTDRRYKQAIEQFTMVKTNVQVKVEEEDTTGDFSPAKPEKANEKTVPLQVDRAAWERKVRKYTTPFTRSPHIYSSRASFSGDVETRWYVNSDGARIKVSQPYYQLFLSASTKADDGMELPRYETFFAFSPEGLPNDEAVVALAEQMVADLEALREAPLVEPYTGPAILSGRASGVFFHEILGHRLEGHRQKLADEGQTFRKMVGERVLPASFSVIFDPTATRAGGTDLIGTYRYDNQGVKARRVPVIEDGVLTNFLMSRMPIDGFARSNGHGRKNVGYRPVARQSNLIVEVKDAASEDELKRQLVELLAEQDKPFGLYFDDIQGGFTLTGRYVPNAFNVTPIMVYRLHRDGREELVRGVDLIGTPLTAFSMIAAGADRSVVFNGLCGAESGSVPVSAISPAILVSQIEVQKKEKSQDRTPILAPPSPRGANDGAHSFHHGDTTSEVYP